MIKICFARITIITIIIFVSTANPFELIKRDVEKYICFYNNSYFLFLLIVNTLRDEEKKL